jgi:hypothetical protein
VLPSAFLCQAQGRDGPKTSPTCWRWPGSMPTVSVIRGTVDSEMRNPAALFKSFWATVAKLSVTPKRLTRSAAPGVGSPSPNPEAPSPVMAVLAMVVGPVGPDRAKQTKHSLAPIANEPRIFPTGTR